PAGHMATSERNREFGSPLTRFVAGCNTATGRLPEDPPFVFEARSNGLGQRFGLATTYVSSNDICFFIGENRGAAANVRVPSVRHGREPVRGSSCVENG